MEIFHIWLQWVLPLEEECNRHYLFFYKRSSLDEKSLIEP